MPHPHTRAAGCSACEQRRRQIMADAAAAAKGVATGNISAAAGKAIGVITGISAGALEMMGLKDKMAAAPPASEPTPPSDATESDSEQASPAVSADHEASHRGAATGAARA